MLYGFALTPHRHNVKFVFRNSDLDVFDVVRNFMDDINVTRYICNNRMDVLVVMETAN